ncbi:MAG: hypothetical protein AAGJ56_01290 [Myxococcota bacterium]
MRNLASIDYRYAVPFEVHPLYPGYLTKVTGPLTAHDAETIVSQLETMIADSERNYGFNDWFEATRYETHARVIFTRFVIRNRARIAAVYLGINRSPMLSMGAQVANTALGGFMRIYNERARFDQALEDYRRDHPAPAK